MHTFVRVQLSPTIGALKSLVGLANSACLSTWTSCYLWDTFAQLEAATATAQSLQSSRDYCLITLESSAGGSGCRLSPIVCVCNAKSNCAIRYIYELLHLRPRPTNTKSHLEAVSVTLMVTPTSSELRPITLTLRPPTRCNSMTDKQHSPEQFRALAAAPVPPT